MARWNPADFMARWNPADFMAMKSGRFHAKDLYIIMQCISVLVLMKNTGFSGRP